MGEVTSPKARTAAARFLHVTALVQAPWRLRHGSRYKDETDGVVLAKDPQPCLAPQGAFGPVAVADAPIRRMPLRAPLRLATQHCHESKLLREWAAQPPLRHAADGLLERDRENHARLACTLIVRAPSFFPATVVPMGEREPQREMILLFAAPSTRTLVPIRAIIRTSWHIGPYWRQNRRNVIVHLKQTLKYMVA